METMERSTADLRKSCDLCCSRKRRCDGDGVNPCMLCTSKGQSCTYSVKGRRGPKPKPKRPRFDMMGISIHGDGETIGDGGLSNDPSILEWEEDEDGSSQPPPHKTPRISDIVRLSPSQATGVLGLPENEHLNAFFSGFGACTQIVQEDEIRGAMIHILSEGQFGMPDVEGKSFYSPPTPSPSCPTKRAFGSGDQFANNDNPTDLPMIRLAGGGLGIPVGDPIEGSGSVDERQRAQRARLSAGVACLWAGIGVGAMLCGHTAEATLHYAENAREAIKGCYDVVSEEVLRAFFCLAHMHSFREDFGKFSRYTAMAKNVAASLDRQGEESASEASLAGGSRGLQAKGCSEPAKFLLKCFDAMSIFLELEGEEVTSYVEGMKNSSQSPSSLSISEDAGVNRNSGSSRPIGVRAAGDAATTDDANGVHGVEDARRRREKKNDIEMPLYRGASNGVEKDKLPGYASAVRVQKCIDVLSDNQVTQHLGSLALSRRGSSNGRDQQQWGRATNAKQRIASGDGAEGDDGDGGCDLSSSLKEESHLVNQVLFVGDTRILEISMSVDCSCIRVMCKAVSGADWAEVAKDARVVANTADGILLPVLASSSISRSVCSVKLLADSAFSHLCLGNADDALRAVRRFCAILKEFPGIMRFPPWRHCFHWMAGMLESAGLRNEYNCLRDGLKKINMKKLQMLPEFGNAAHDVMCKCSHVRCQATHRALAEHAKRDPYGSFRVPAHCPHFGTAAKSSAYDGNPGTFRSVVRGAVPAASQWPAPLNAVSASCTSGGVGAGGGVDVGVGVPSRRPSGTVTSAPATVAQTPSTSPVPSASTAPAALPASTLPAVTPRGKGIGTGTTTVAEAMAAVGPSRRGAATAKTAKEAAKAAASRRATASSTPTSASQSPVMGSAAACASPARSAVTTRARAEGGSRRRTLVTPKTGDQRASRAVATPGAENVVSSGVNIETHPRRSEDNIWRSNDAVSDDQPPSRAPISESSFDLLAMQSKSLGSEIERAPPFPRGGGNVGTPWAGSVSDPMVARCTSAAAAVHGGQTDGQHSTSTLVTSREDISTSGTWSSVDGSSPALVAYNPSDPGTSFVHFLPAFRGGSGSSGSGGGGGGGPCGIPTDISLPHGARRMVYGNPAVGDGVVGGGGLADIVGGPDFNVPVGGNNVPGRFRCTGMGGGMNSPAQGGTGGSALVSNAPPEMGAGSGTGTGPSFRTGNFLAGTDIATVPGSIGLSGGSSSGGFNTGTAYFSESGLGDNGGAGDPVSEFGGYGKEDDQLWASEYDDPEMGVSSMNTEMNVGHGEGPSDLEAFTRALVGMLPE